MRSCLMRMGMYSRLIAGSLADLCLGCRLMSMSSVACLMGLDGMATSYQRVNIGTRS